MCDGYEMLILLVCVLISLVQIVSTGSGDVTVVCASCPYGGSKLIGMEHNDLTVQYTIYCTNFSLLTVYFKNSKIVITPKNVHLKDVAKEDRLVVPRTVENGGSFIRINITLKKLSLEEDNDAAFTYEYMDSTATVHVLRHGHNVVTVNATPTFCKSRKIIEIGAGNNYTIEFSLCGNPKPVVISAAIGLRNVSVKYLGESPTMRYSYHYTANLMLEKKQCGENLKFKVKSFVQKELLMDVKSLCVVTLLCTSCKDGGTRLEGKVGEKLEMIYRVTNMNFSLLRINYDTSEIRLTQYRLNRDDIQDKRLSVSDPIFKSGNSVQIKITLRRLAMEDNFFNLKYSYTDHKANEVHRENNINVQVPPSLCKAPERVDRAQNRYTIEFTLCGNPKPSKVTAKFDSVNVTVTDSTSGRYNFSYRAQFTIKKEECGGYMEIIAENFQSRTFNNRTVKHMCKEEQRTTNLIVAIVAIVAAIIIIPVAIVVVAITCKNTKKNIQHDARSILRSDDDENSAMSRRSDEASYIEPLESGDDDYLAPLEAQGTSDRTHQYEYVDPNTLRNGSPDVLTYPSTSARKFAACDIDTTGGKFAQYVKHIKHNVIYKLPSGVERHPSPMGSPEDKLLDVNNDKSSDTSNVNTACAVYDNTRTNLNKEYETMNEYYGGLQTEGRQSKDDGYATDCQEQKL